MSIETSNVPLRFRKKPVVIEAVRFEGTKDSANSILAWIGVNGGRAERKHRTDPRAGLVIATLEGEHLASEGDWIIRGVAGEFYPCRPDIFEKTYELVE